MSKPDETPDVTVPEAIPDELRERVIKEELARLDSEAARLIQLRRNRIQDMKNDPVLWHAVERTDDRIRVEGGSEAEAFLIEQSSVFRELRRAYYHQLWAKIKPKAEGGRGLSMDEAVKEMRLSMKEDKDKWAVLSMYEWHLHRDMADIGWQGLEEMYREEPLFAEDLWRRIKEEARQEFESGHFVAKIFEHTEAVDTPFKRAEFLAARESLREQWKPQGGIDDMMVDMLAVLFFQWTYWTRQGILRAETEPRRESHDYREWREGRKRMYFRNGEKLEHGYSGQFIDGEWDLPFQHEAEAISQAVEMADRYRRAFQAQLRQMRDWRRYPVIVQNAEQVNIAGDGGQQVNVKNGRKKAASKPKQLSRKKEVITMEAEVQQVK